MKYFTISYNSLTHNFVWIIQENQKFEIKSKAKMYFVNLYILTYTKIYKQRSYLEIENMAFKDSVKFISSLAYFVEHLHVIFEPSEINSDENHQKILKAIDYLLTNHTIPILKKVSFVTVHRKVTYFT